MKQIRAVVENAFLQAFAGIVLAEKVYTEVGRLVFYGVRLIVSAIRDIVLGLIDIADGLTNGTFRAVKPKK